MKKIIPDEYLEHCIIIFGLLIEIALALSINFIAEIYPPKDSTVGEILLTLIIIVMLLVLLLGGWLSIRYHRSVISIKDATEKLISNTKDYILDQGVKDVTIKYHFKEIVISKDILEKGTCKFSHRIQIQNHMEKRYDYYIFDIQSSESVSDLDKFKIKKDGRKIDSKGLNYQKYTHNSITCEESIESGETSLKSIPERHGCKMYIPVGVKSHHTSEIEIIENECPSFENLKYYNDPKKHSLESLGAFVSHHTEIMTFNVYLDESMPNYILERGDESDKNSEHEDFKVIDKCEQRMDHYENALEERKTDPKYSNDKRKLTWTVYNPKVGYLYRLYFTISEIS